MSSVLSTRTTAALASPPRGRWKNRSVLQAACFSIYHAPSPAGAARTWAGSPSCWRRVSRENPKGFAGQVQPFSKAVNQTAAACDGQIDNWFLPLGITKGQNLKWLTYNSFQEKYTQGQNQINQQALRILEIGWDPSPFTPLYTCVQTHTHTLRPIHTLTYMPNTHMYKHTQNTCVNT